MNFRFYGYCMNKVNRDMPYWYWWIMLKLYILCLEHKVETGIIVPEIRNWLVKISVNWLVSTEFMIAAHWLEIECENICCICWTKWIYRWDIGGVYCLYHYIIEKTKRVWKKIVLNFN